MDHLKSGPIDELERQMRNLEMKVYGEAPYPSSVPTTIVDSFAQNLLTTTMALTGQDKLNSLIRQLDFLEMVLDPCYEDKIAEKAVKMQLIKSFEPLLLTMSQQLSNIAELSQCLDSQPIKNVHNMSERILHLTLVALRNQEQSNSVSSDVLDFIKRYNSMVHNMSISFALMDDIVKKMEAQLQIKISE